LIYFVVEFFLHSVFSWFYFLLFCRVCIGTYVIYLVRWIFFRQICIWLQVSSILWQFFFRFYLLDMISSNGSLNFCCWINYFTNSMPITLFLFLLLMFTRWNNFIFTHRLYFLWLLFFINNTLFRSIFYWITTDCFINLWF